MSLEKSKPTGWDTIGIFNNDWRMGGGGGNGGKSKACLKKHINMLKNHINIVQKHLKKITWNLHDTKLCVFEYSNLKMLNLEYSNVE